MKARAASTLALVGTLAVGLLVVLGAGADAKEQDEFLPAFEAAYPDAVGSRIASCSLCHFTDSDGEWDENQFADDFEEADQSFIAIENADSDGDGFTNLEEIEAGTFPGSSSDNPSTVVTTTTVAAAPGTGESIYQANCAACHGGGGGNLLGRGLTLNQVSSAVTTGVTGMPGYAGALTPGEIDLVSQYVVNADSAPTTTTTTAPGTPPPPPPDGSALYTTNCSACHGSNGGDLVTSTLSHSQLVSATTNGTGGGMPPFGSSLTAAEIEAIISYVESVVPAATTTTAPGTPPPPPPSGQTVYANNCAACHGASGGDLIGRSLTKSQVSTVTNSGTTGMPAFSSKLTSAEVDAVSSYVAALSATTPTTTSTVAGAPAPDGATVYAESCAACHGASGGDLIGHSLSDSQLRSVTNNGQGSMPGFTSRLSSAEVDAVVAYVSSVGSDSPTQSGEVGIDASALYTTFCSACHGAHGAGGSGGPVAGTSLSRGGLIRVTANGRDSMPAYSDRLDEDEIAAIADFILDLSSAAVDSDMEEVGDTPGAHLYGQLCASCHGATGEGGIGGAIIGEDLNATEVASLLRLGTPGMPAYPDLSDDELSALIEHTLQIATGMAVIETEPVETNDDEEGEDEAVQSESESLSVFRDDEEPNSGLSPFTVAGMILIALGLVGGVGYVGLRSWEGLSEST